MHKHKYYFKKEVNHIRFAGVNSGVLTKARKSVHWLFSVATIFLLVFVSIIPSTASAAGIPATNISRGFGGKISFTAPPHEAGKYDVEISYSYANRSYVLSQALSYKKGTVTNPEQPKIPGAPNAGYESGKLNQKVAAFSAIIGFASIVIISSLIKSFARKK